MLKRIFLIFINCCAIETCNNVTKGEPSIGIFLRVNGEDTTGAFQNSVYVYNTGDQLEFSCVAYNMDKITDYYCNLFHIRNNDIFSLPTLYNNTDITYTITANHLDNNNTLYCSVTEGESNAVFLSPRLRIIVNTDSMSYYRSIPKVYYNGNISINHMCDGLGKENVEYYEQKFINADGTEYFMTGELKNNLLLLPSISGSILFCLNLIGPKNPDETGPQRYIRMTYNMTKYIYKPTASNETLPSSIGDKIPVIVGVVVCVIILPIIITVTYLRCKRSNKTPAVQFTPPKPHVPLYESISLPMMEGVSRPDALPPLPQRPPLALPSEALEAPSVHNDNTSPTYDYVYSHMVRPGRPAKISKKPFNQGVPGRH